jgi:hypothetical protein
MILPLRLIFVVDFFTEANKPRLPQWMLRHWIKVLFELDFFYIHQKWNTLLGNSAYHIYILSISAFLSTLILKSTGPYLGYGTCPGTNDYMDLLFHARFLHCTWPFRLYACLSLLWFVFCPLQRRPESHVLVFLRLNPILTCRHLVACRVIGLF